MYSAPRAHTAKTSETALFALSGKPVPLASQDQHVEISPGVWPRLRVQGLWGEQTIKLPMHETHARLIGKSVAKEAGGRQTKIRVGRIFPTSQYLRTQAGSPIA